MFEQIHSNPDIYKVPVVLPNNPLKKPELLYYKDPIGKSGDRYRV